MCVCVTLHRMLNAHKVKSMIADSDLCPMRTLTLTEPPAILWPVILLISSPLPSNYVPHDLVFCVHSVQPQSAVERMAITKSALVTQCPQSRSRLQDKIKKKKKITKKYVVGLVSESAQLSPS